MDAKQVSALSAALFLLAGLTVGALFFVLLRWNTLLYMRGGSATLAVCVQCARIAVLGLVFVSAARYGALPLLLTALGLLIARPIVLRLAWGAS